MPERSRRSTGSSVPPESVPSTSAPITQADIQLIQEELTRLRGQVQGHTEVLDRLQEVFASVREMEAALQRHYRTSEDRAARLTTQVGGVLTAMAQLKETVGQLNANRTEMREEIMRRQDDQLARVVARLDDDVSRSVARATTMTLEQIDGRIEGLASAIEGKFAGLDGVLTKKFQDSADALKRELTDDRKQEATERRDAEATRRKTEEEARRQAVEDAKAREKELEERRKSEISEIEERRKADLKEIKESIAARAVPVAAAPVNGSDWRISIDPLSAKALGVGVVLGLFSIVGTAGYLDSCMDRQTMESVKGELRQEIEADIQKSVDPVKAPPARPKPAPPTRPGTTPVEVAPDAAIEANAEMGPAGGMSEPEP